MPAPTFFCYSHETTTNKNVSLLFDSLFVSLPVMPSSSSWRESSCSLHHLTVMSIIHLLPHSGRVTCLKTCLASTSWVSVTCLFSAACHLWVSRSRESTLVLCVCLQSILSHYLVFHGQIEVSHPRTKISTLHLFATTTSNCVMLQHSSLRREYLCLCCQSFQAKQPSRDTKRTGCGRDTFQTQKVYSRFVCCLPLVHSCKLKHKLQDVMWEWSGRRM